MKEINGDITEVAYGYVCHQVNCQGVMGGGVALAIRNKWPSAYTQYRQAYKEGRLALGNTIWTTVGPQITVIHICGQDRYGRDRRYTDYTALEQALTIIRMHATQNIPIYFPDHIGCGLAGGDWNIVKEIIEKHIPNATIIELTK